MMLQLQLQLISRPIASFPPSVQEWVRSIQLPGVPVKGDKVDGLFVKRNDGSRVSSLVTSIDWDTSGDVTVHVKGFTVSTKAEIESVPFDFRQPGVRYWASDLWGDITEALTASDWIVKP